METLTPFALYVGRQHCWEPLSSPVTKTAAAASDDESSIYRCRNENSTMVSNRSNTALHSVLQHAKSLGLGLFTREKSCFGGGSSDEEQQQSTVAPSPSTTPKTQMRCVGIERFVAPITRPCEVVEYLRIMYPNHRVGEYCMKCFDELGGRGSIIEPHTLLSVAPVYLSRGKITFNQASQKWLCNMHRIQHTEAKRREKNKALRRNNISRSVLVDQKKAIHKLVMGAYSDATQKRIKEILSDAGEKEKVMQRRHEIVLANEQLAYERRAHAFHVPEFSLEASAARAVVGFCAVQTCAKSITCSRRRMMCNSHYNQVWRVTQRFKNGL